MAKERGPVRDEQHAMTRRRILDACAELALREGGLDDPAVFTYARVAELAGVSERTVYRAFPTKNDLTAAFLDEATLTRGEPIPTDAADLAPFVRRVTRAWDEQFPSRADGRRRRRRSASTADEANAARLARDRAIETATASALPEGMKPAERRAVGGVIRLLTSFRSVAQTAARFDVTLAEAGEAHAWAIDSLITALQRAEVPQ